ncbi:RimK family alpha-L-glutamate ligase [Streptomyces sp. ODS05-4]|uniref:ATP-grasp domain-containing protein n=1 Tax=Streptomyces sp. ODS05-4 TaxID=2944939 RepID=UPI002108DD1C|nr:hypothetical protein [Streptomyces sp. ODS05-4]
MADDLKIAYLSLRQPHDEFPDVVRHLSDEGVHAELVMLRDAATIRWEEYDLLSLRMLRYFHLESDLVARTAELAELLGADAKGHRGRIVNPVGLIADGLDKAYYLPRLAAEDVPTVPSRWITAGTPVTLRETMRELPWDEAVVKPTLSSRGWSTFRVSRASRGAEHPAPEAEHPHFVLTDEPGDGTDSLPERAFRELVARGNLCVQPFVPSIRSAGELSFVYLGGRLSHVVRKKVALDNWIAHESFGGTNTAVPCEREQADWADSVHALLEKQYGRLTYARIDSLPADDGGLQLLECELVAPRLFLAEGDAFGRYTAVLKAAALERRAGLVPPVLP